MAEREERIILIRVDASSAIDGSRSATSALERMERQQAKVAASLGQVENMLRRVGGMLAGAFSARAILQAVDAFTALSNAIKVTGAEGASLAYVQERLFAAANKNGVEVQALGQLYSRTALAGKELGISQERLLEFVDGVTAALRVQGGTTEQASGALLQLSQALGAGIVRAEEFNSILEGALPIAQAAARGMDGMSGSVAKLRAAVIDGKVTSQQFFEATMKGFGETRKQAESASLTIGQSITSLTNSFTNYIGQADKASGASAALARAISAIGKSLDEASKSTQAGDGGLFGTGLFDPAKMIAGQVKEFEAIGAAFDRLDKNIRAIPFAEWIERNITAPLDDFNVAAARSAAQFIEAFRQIPDALGKLFVDGMNKAIAAVEDGLNSITAAFAGSWLGRQVGASGSPTSFGRIGGGGFSAQDYSGAIEAAGREAGSRLRERQNAEIDRRERARAIDRQAGYASDEDRARLGGMPVSGPLGLGGSATPPAGKDGQGVADRIADLRRDTTRELAAEMAAADAAAKGGAKAVADLGVHYKALKAAQDAYGNTADKNKGQVAALTAEIEKQMAAAEKAKSLKEFSLSTEELEKQNEVLEAENRLINESVEVRSREVALIKLRQETQAKGLDSTNEKEREAIERREAAITQNERLKGQAEELRRSNELWLEPLKSGLQSLQQTGADFWDSILEKGKFSAEEFGQLFKTMARRAIAELLSIATVRPAIDAAIGGLSSLGLVSPATASALGYPQGGARGGGGSLFGGGGIGGGLFSGGGGLGGFWNRPITFGGPIMSSASSPASQAVPHGATGAGLGGITWGQGISAAAGLGMGAYQLATSKGNTGQLIGGIASMVGAGVSLIPGVGQIAGPIISMLGGILPGLFGGGEPPPPANRTAGQLRWSGGGFTTGGGAWGPDANVSGLLGTLGGAGKNIAGLFKLAGGVGGYGGGVDVETFAQGDFSNQTTYVVGPDGQRRQWGQSSEGDAGLDTALAHMAHSALTMSDTISDRMREGLVGFGMQNLDHAFSTQELGQAITEIKAFEEAMESLGKTTTAAEDALKQIDDGFKSLYETADRYGFDRGEIDAKRAAERLKVGTDFAEGIARQLMDDRTGALFDLDKERADLIKNNDALKAVEGYQDQIANIEALYGKKRVEIVERFAQEAARATEAAAAQARQQIESLQELIRSLTPGGALANVDPRSQLAGLTATYRATYAQASAGDQAARNRYTSDATALAEFARPFFAGSPEYNRIRDEILANAQTLQIAIGGAATTAGGGNPGNAAVTMQMQQLMSIVTQQAQQIETLMAELRRTNALLARQAAA